MDTTIEHQKFSLVKTSYSLYHLSDLLNNDTLCEEIESREELRLNTSPTHTGYEDTLLPNTPQAKRLLSYIEQIMKSIDKNLMPVDKWAHILRPGESTMYHNHIFSTGPISLAWCYYAKCEKNCGDLILVNNVYNEDVMVPITPKVGMVVVFPSFVSHFTSRNISGATRISASGNYICKNPQGRVIYDYVGESKRSMVQ